MQLGLVGWHATMGADRVGCGGNFPSKGLPFCSDSPVVFTSVEKCGSVGGWRGKQSSPQPAHSGREPQCVGIAMQDSASHFVESGSGGCNSGVTCASSNINCRQSTLSAINLGGLQQVCTSSLLFFLSNFCLKKWSLFGACEGGRLGRPRGYFFQISQKRTFCSYRTRLYTVTRNGKTSYICVRAKQT